MPELARRRLERLGAAAQGVIAGGLRGVEKEALRIAPDGRLAATPHPRALGSALTHAYITTDYSEALLEFVTPPMPSSVEVIDFLADLHRYTATRIGDELLWATSMPCMLSGDDHIPLARYGDSNVGRMKTIYRRGLGYRYGRTMQTISGVHFNYSLPESFWAVYQAVEGHAGGMEALRSEAYMALVRNFHRLGWLVLYLFGASPAVCRSFFAGRESGLQAFDSGTVYTPYATSLRMSDLGYKNRDQARLRIPLNSLEEYIDGLTHAIATPNPAYERIGVEVDGEWRQLSTSWLQIENEYYSVIRPKRVARSGERPTQALKRCGVQYVEVRALDVNAFEPVGVSACQLRFLEALLLHCMLSESPPIHDSEYDAIERNQRRVAWEGRRPGFMLERGGGEVALAEWASEVLDHVAEVAELLDAPGDGSYTRAVAAQRAVLEDPARLPSARLLAEMAAHDESFFQLARRLSADHASALLADAADPAREGCFTAEAESSLERQRALEAAERIDFRTHLANYYAGVDTVGG